MGSGKTFFEISGEKTMFFVLTEDNLFCKIGKDAGKRSSLVITAVVH